MLERLRVGWLWNLRGDLLAGATSALAIIPGTLAFSFIAGVSPMIGLCSSICILVLISLFGGRPAMLSASAGSMTLVMTPLVARYGVEYLFAASILAGAMQYLMGRFGLGSLMRFVPHAVITGFVNALGVLIFLDQLHQIAGRPWTTDALVVGAVAFIFVVPRLTRSLPPALLAVAILTGLVAVTGLHTTRVGDVARITRALPLPHLPHVPFTAAAWAIVLTYALSLAVVGYTETLLTAEVIDEMTHMRSDKNLEMRGQGIANVVSGLLGGMAGCALVGESYLNVRSGGRSRLSTLAAGITVLLLVAIGGPVLRAIPMAALNGVMVAIAIQLVDWRHLWNLRRMPTTEGTVMVVTVGIVLATHNLALGVVAGVLLSGIFFAHQASRLDVRHECIDGERCYYVRGQLFFASAPGLLEAIDFDDSAAGVCIDISAAQLWDHSARVMLDRVVRRLEGMGKTVRLVGETW